MYQKDKFQSPENAYGPIQIVHDFQFVALNLDSEMYTFPPEMGADKRREHIARRIERLKERGYAGLVLSVDNKNYLEDETALEQMAWAIDYAHEKGLRIWIYDEQYYPTGGAGGLVLRDHPELESMALACVQKDVEARGSAVRIMSPHGHSALQFAFARNEAGEQMDISRWQDPAGNLCWDAPKGKWRIWCYFLRPLYEATYLTCALRAPRRYPNVADQKSMARFLDVTWGAYEQAFGDRLKKKVEAVFTDEPSFLWYTDYPENWNPKKIAPRFASVSICDCPDMDMPIYPYIHWPTGVEEIFEKRCGYALAPRLPDLFSTDFENTQALRRDFYETLHAMFDRAYNDQFIHRLHGNEMKFSGHYIAEEGFAGHPGKYGDILHHLGCMDIPGCDLLYSAPHKTRHSLACKVASSAAHQYGKPFAMIEASNMKDEDQTFSVERLELAMASLHALGVNTITSYYGEELFDEAEYRRFTAYTARLGALLSGGVHQSQLLLYYPYEQFAALTAPECLPKSETAGMMEAQLQEFSEILLSRQADYDFINREVLLQCSFDQGEILTPCGERPKALLFPWVPFVDEQVADAVEKAVQAGVRVIFGGKRREIPGLKSLEGVEFTEECGLPVSCDVQVEKEELLVAYHYRAGEQQIYLLVNTGENEIRRTASLPLQGEKLTLLDLDRGTDANLPCRQVNDRIAFDLALPPMSAVVVIQEKR